MLRISSMLQSGVAPTTFWLVLTKPSLSCLGWGNFSPSSLVTSLFLSLLGQGLVPVAAARDLGVTLDSNLTFNGHTASPNSPILSTSVQINRVPHLFSKDVVLYVYYPKFRATCHSLCTKQPCWDAIWNYVCLLFLLPQCDFCVPAWRFCTMWMASCKGPIYTGPRSPC